MMIKNVASICFAIFMFMSIGKFSFADDQLCSISCFSTRSSNISTIPTQKYSDPTQAFISLTGRAIMCTKNTLNVMFDERCEKQNILKQLKARLKNVVYVALTLFIVLLGLKIVTTGETPSKTEIFTTILKFGFVLYFTIGTGLNDIVYTGGMAAMTSLANFLMVPPSGGFCSFDPNSYASGYSYLAMWDSIDCRISQYLFIGLSRAGVTTPAYFGVLGLVIPLIFSLQLIFAIFLIIFAIFILSIAASILHFFILAMLGLALMTYFGVIFVPMILFSYTKQFFDSWWQTALSCAIQPIVMTAFIAFPFLVFDRVMYDHCTFTQQGKIWVVNESRASDTCKASLGYKFNDIIINSNKYLQNIVGFFFNFTVFRNWNSNFTDLFSALLRVLFFCFLFLKFAEYGGSLAAKLTGGPEISQFTAGMTKLLGEAWNKFTKKPKAKKVKSADKVDEGVKVESTTSRGGI